MYSHDETVLAVRNFYEQLILHPYLPSSSLIFPPPSGWPTLSPTVDTKNSTVRDLLQHLPYLRPEKRNEKLNIHWESFAIDYSSQQDTGSQFAESDCPLPDHCVYLACKVDREGTALIIDTKEGMITEIGPRSKSEVEGEAYESLPLAEKWTKHSKTPITEFLGAWTEKYRKIIWMLVPNPIGQPTSGRFYSRAENLPMEEELLQLQGPWQYQVDEKASEDRRRQMKHVADIYNMYLNHGWPDHFEKEACRAAVLDLEKSEDEELWRRLDEIK